MSWTPNGLTHEAIAPEGTRPSTRMTSFASSEDDFIAPKRGGGSGLSTLQPPSRRNPSGSGRIASPSHANCHSSTEQSLLSSTSHAYFASEKVTSTAGVTPATFGYS